MSFQENSKTHIHWFRDDLRILDQPFEFLANYTHFFGVYIIQPKHIAYTDYGFRKMGLNRLYHLRASLFELQKALRSKNSDLLVRFGEPDKILKDLASQYNASISFQKEYGTEEQKEEGNVINQLQNKIITWEGNFLIHPDEITFHKENFPKSFSGFRKKAEKICKNKEFKTTNDIDFIPDTPTQFASIKEPIADYHYSSAVPFHGGCLSGVKRINEYFFESENVAKYKETRNELIGKDYSSKFSIYLANGALSSMQIMVELTRFEQNITKNKSTYWLYFELLWRDYFRHALRFYGRKMFLQNGLQQNELVFKNTERSFLKWINAKTPSSFVNANMKELKITGFMSNRGRQNVASFLVHDLGEDWRKGAAWFEHCLIDYDVASNQGNWMYITGIGFNPKGKSRFDINFQVDRYDPERKYIHLWTKEQL
jgi:deoxyribodipyrimidine photo-lyase